jgi:hypothetical protein
MNVSGESLSAGVKATEEFLETVDCGGKLLASANF